MIEIDYFENTLDSREIASFETETQYKELELAYDMDGKEVYTVSTKRYLYSDSDKSGVINEITLDFRTYKTYGRANKFYLTNKY